MTDAIFSAFSERVTSARNVEFVLDGVGTPGANRTCLAQMWRPWNTTYISGSDPNEATFSNNATLGYDRMIWLDDPVPMIDPALWIQILRPLNYGKFQDEPVPFLFWEPSNQVESSCGLPSPI